MSDFVVRLFNDYEQLQRRIEKLRGFILSDKYDGLPEIDRADLKKQLKYMESYLSVLARRVSRQCNSA